MGAPRRVLVVAAEPDARESSVTLAEVCRELDRRGDVELAVWFLRDGEVDSWWEGSRTVDRLRLDPPPLVAMLDRLGAASVAAPLRGRELRRWWAEVDPDVVLFDDGVGERVVPAGANVRRLVRINSTEPPTKHVEPRASSADMFLRADATDQQSLEMPTHLLHLASLADRAEVARADLRLRLDLQPETLVVGGEGLDEWLDAPDAFVRALWYLRDRRGLEPVAVWFEWGQDPGVVERIEDEAARCGITVNVLPGHHDDDLLGVDATLALPRVPLPRRRLLELVAAGQRVVTCSPAALDDPAVTVVEALDTEAAGIALAAALDGGRQGRVESASVRLDDVVRWCDDLLRRLGQTG